ncbi:PREDICTED: membrane-spanning 4-domains subfamily A member 8 [Bison bison bison]|uniref:Membrane-spanning 4-domains subfamily A member 8 n=1 Tax=Bison bison bison TaxID=43346 RepID=A0A6P3HWW1_BISBB|nr:PREDICTED: membrane-spanning 4-domains subfamily A member 8 [Bison bison bison]XP_010843016.1 PREDICTED: membrane-spanning 4-domains subfamily A member 8 [Bison bison bison]XP_010843017.1 PREDICTED: membrane-spanning 4-domains subfamily A member 8 [Bison bison bison]XP_010843018.1 PREDICTED: membrane-spanning 4-domains subfamily A member 8 [Bison bison bison]
MNPTTSAGPMANSVFVVTPPNGYTVLPGGVSQVPIYPNQSQVHVIHGNPPCVSQQPTERTLKEGKALGATQILIGLIHLGLGSVMGTVLVGNYTAVSFYGGFPFWGGIWFIISGSLSVLAEKHSRSSCLLNSSVGFNIVSAIFSMVGITLFIVELIINSTYIYPLYDPPSHTWGRVPGMAVSGLLLIFCILEVFIASISAHFGCQLTCYQTNNVGVVIPNVYVTNPAVIPEPENSPPNYSDVPRDK